TIGAGWMGTYGKGMGKAAEMEAQKKGTDPFAARLGISGGGTRRWAGGDILKGVKSISSGAFEKGIEKAGIEQFGRLTTAQFVGKVMQNVLMRSQLFGELFSSWTFFQGAIIGLDSKGRSTLDKIFFGDWLGMSGETALENMNEYFKGSNGMITINGKQAAYVVDEANNTVTLSVDGKEIVYTKDKAGKITSVTIDGKKYKVEIEKGMWRITVNKTKYSVNIAQEKPMVLVNGEKHSAELSDGVWTIFKDEKGVKIKDLSEIVLPAFNAVQTTEKEINTAGRKFSAEGQNFIITLKATKQGTFETVIKDDEGKAVPLDKIDYETQRQLKIKVENDIAMNSEVIATQMGEKTAEMGERLVKKLKVDENKLVSISMGINSIPEGGDAVTTMESIKKEYELTDETVKYFSHIAEGADIVDKHELSADDVKTLSKLEIMADDALKFLEKSELNEDEAAKIVLYGKAQEIMKLTGMKNEEAAFLANYEKIKSMKDSELALIKTYGKAAEVQGVMGGIVGNSQKITSETLIDQKEKFAEIPAFNPKNNITENELITLNYASKMFDDLGKQFEQQEKGVMKAVDTKEKDNQYLALQIMNAKSNASSSIYMLNPSSELPQAEIRRGLKENEIKKEYEKVEHYYSSISDMANLAMDNPKMSENQKENLAEFVSTKYDYKLYSGDEGKYGNTSTLMGNYLKQNPEFNFKADMDKMVEIGSIQIQKDNKQNIAAIKSLNYPDVSGLDAQTLLKKGEEFKKTEENRLIKLNPNKDPGELETYNPFGERYTKLVGDYTESLEYYQKAVKENDKELIEKTEERKELAVTELAAYIAGEIPDKYADKLIPKLAYSAPKTETKNKKSSGKDKK
ncbi:hypothetical protein JXB01_04635, partial [Candidatus Micrarchaeota archaeon]|nr:hypothetical protein [Candidatus Micrarchaeota archaeon]